MNYTLPCDVQATGFIIRNTHNDFANNAGTRDYTIVNYATNFSVNATSANPQNMVIEILHFDILTVFRLHNQRNPDAAKNLNPDPEDPESRSKLFLTLFENNI